MSGSWWPCIRQHFFLSHGFGFICTPKRRVFFCWIGSGMAALQYWIQHPTGQTALLQALQIGHIRLKDYSKTKKIDIFLLSMLSIMSTNHFCPTADLLGVQAMLQSNTIVVEGKGGGMGLL